MATTPAYGQNPYIAQQSTALQNQSNQNLAQNVMPGIGRGATGAGQYGGTRQGIAEGVAAGNAQTGVANAQANLYSTAYGQDQNFANQNRSMDLTNQGQMQNFYTQQRGQDQSGMQLGANLYSMGNSGNLGIGAGQTAIGQQYQNAPINALQQYSNTISPYSGLGSSQVTTGSSNAGAQGVVGGALAGAQMFSNLNLGMGSNTSQTNPVYDSYGLNVAGY